MLSQGVSFVFEGISRIIEKTIGKSEAVKDIELYKDLPEHSWTCNESGLYAAAVYVTVEGKKVQQSYAETLRISSNAMPDSKKLKGSLSITIYDFLEKKGFVYFEEQTNFKPDYFYWFKDDIILVHIEEYTEIQQLHMKLDHQNRKSELMNIKKHSFPVVLANEQFEPSMKDFFPPPQIEYIHSVNVNGEEYLPLFNSTMAATLLTPKDPNSKLKIIVTFYLYPDDEEHLVNGRRRPAILPIPNEQFLYFTRVLLIDNRKNCKYYLDTFKELDLNQLDDFSIKVFVDLDSITFPTEASRDVSFTHIGTTEDIYQPFTVYSSRNYGNGQVLAAVKGNTSKRCHICHIDVKTRRITWNEWKDIKYQREFNLILATLYPTGYFIQMDYKKKKQNNKYELFCKTIGHPNNVINLKKQTLMKCLSTDIPIKPKYIAALSRIL